MSGDKRTVATDALASLGTFIGDGEKRDAIHLAVEPVIAGERLEPGEHITVQAGIATRTDPGLGLGIVDPFLPRAAKKGDRFWFIMYPRQVHSLRHVWTHPAFPDEATSAQPAAGADPVAASKQWIAAYADRLGLHPNDLINGAKEFLDLGEYLCRGGLLEGESTEPEFWTHFQIVTGRAVPADKRESFFSCSC